MDYIRRPCPDCLRTDFLARYETSLSCRQTSWRYFDPKGKIPVLFPYRNVNYFEYCTDACDQSSFLDFQEIVFILQSGLKR